ncbi:hypothetical protein [Xanthocytophaga agilis]|uniref:Uncharacterized protein n=1 Tax=Xanthocytophaga agilis TaxID=3048010 RepID=A0AAE3R3K3_9BACT|nr:hypothetical protein [Xanthocytophaga agilis]MDJ1500047.1 hypothetical protein [Xanthocytophaga agilis]
MLVKIGYEVPNGLEWMKHRLMKLKKYAIRFTPDYREFLKILHTIDRKEVTCDTGSSENGEEEITEEKPFFYT